MPVKRKAQLGDVLEVFTGKGLAYLQYTHQHKMGGVVRVLKGLHRQRPDSLQALVDDDHSFVVLFPVVPSVQDGVIAVVGNYSIPERYQPFPLFRTAGLRDAKGNVPWWTWDGESLKPISSLTTEMKRLPIRRVVNEAMLVKMIEQGWLPENDSTKY